MAHVDCSLLFYLKSMQEKIKLECTRTIELIQFVNQSELDNFYRSSVLLALFICNVYNIFSIKMLML